MNITRLGNPSCKDKGNIANIEESHKRNGNWGKDWGKQEDEQAFPPGRGFIMLLENNPNIHHCHGEEGETNDCPTPYYVVLFDKGFPIEDVRPNIEQEQAKVWTDYAADKTKVDSIATQQ